MEHLLRDVNDPSVSSLANQVILNVLTQSVCACVCAASFIPIFPTSQSHTHVCGRINAFVSVDQEQDGSAIGPQGTTA